MNENGDLVAACSGGSHVLLVDTGDDDDSFCLNLATKAVMASLRRPLPRT